MNRPERVGTGRGRPSISSECVLHGKLQDARLDIAKNFTERRILQVGVQAIAIEVATHGEVYMVCNVEKFKSQLKLLLLFDVKPSTYRSVDIKIWRSY